MAGGMGERGGLSRAHHAAVHEARVAREAGVRPEPEAFRHAGQRQIDQQLRQALVPVFRHARGAGQGAHIVRPVRIGCPDLATVQTPAFGRADGTGADTGQVGSSVRFAHADARKKLTARDARNKKLVLSFRAVTQDQWRGLSVCDPVCRNWGTGHKQFLQQNEASKTTTPSTAIGLG